MFKPPRPQINKQIIEAVAEVFVRENIDSLPEYLEAAREKPTRFLR